MILNFFEELSCCNVRANFGGFIFNERFEFDINNDEKFRQVLIGMNKQFYHQVVTTKQIENYITEKSGIDFSKVFDQYLRTIRVPTFEYKITDRSLLYRFTNCVKGFSMPIKIFVGNTKWITPVTAWKELKMPGKINSVVVDKNFYINART